MPRKSAATLAAEAAAAEALAAEQAVQPDDTPTEDAPQDAPEQDGEQPEAPVTSAAQALGVIDTADALLPPADAAATASQGGPTPEAPAQEEPRTPGDHAGEFVRVGAECISFPDGTEWAIDPDTGIVGKRIA